MVLSLTNSLLGSFATFPLRDPALEKLRAQDAAVRSKIGELSEVRGKNTSLKIDTHYRHGPDGKLYAVGATISSTQKIRIGKVDEQEKNQPTDSIAPSPAKPATSVSLADFLPPRIALRPSDQVELFASEPREGLVKADNKAPPLIDYVQITGPDNSYYTLANPAISLDPSKAARQAADYAAAVHTASLEYESDGLHKAAASVAGLYDAKVKSSLFRQADLLDIAA